MAHQQLTFKNQRGDTLSGRLDLPTRTTPLAYAIFAHCFTCGKDLKSARHLSNALTAKGWAVLRFDFTGLGHSQGNFADTNFSTTVDDLLSAAEYLEAHFEAPELLVGHSLGGAAAIQTAAKLDAIKAVATIGAPAHPKHVKKLLEQATESLQKLGRAEINIGGRSFTMHRQFLADLENHEQLKVVKNLRKPLLLLHSPQDAIVSVDNAAEIYRAAHHPKSFISLDGADHLLSAQADALYAGDTIASWVQRYVDTREPTDPDPGKEVSVKTGSNRYLSDVVIGPHNFRVDEPVDLGGENLGPSPNQLLLSALGACTGITLRMYANRKKWPVDEIRIHLSQRNEKTDGKLVIDRFLEFEGPIDQAQQQRLLEIANKCPVHKILTTGVVVETGIRRP